MITRVALRGREVAVFDSKLTAVGYGLLIPFFFITSGMAFDLDALTESAEAMLKVPLFLALFLVVRGTPAPSLPRRARGPRPGRARLLLRDRASPGRRDNHRRDRHRPHALDTAAGLVGAAISTLIYP